MSGNRVLPEIVLHPYLCPLLSYCLEYYYVCDSDPPTVVPLVQVVGEGVYYTAVLSTAVALPALSVCSRDSGSLTAAFLSSYQTRLPRWLARLRTLPYPRPVGIDSQGAWRRSCGGFE
ncbi:hypothetical protein E4T56_gene13105 [Termitomyces sp. T112]|nr:hypothetical protein E4T56_gene13105 [Termitomyces sp. T112]